MSAPASQSHNASSRRLPSAVGAPLLSIAALGLCALALEVFLRLSGLQPPFLYQLDEQACAKHVPGMSATITSTEFQLPVRFNSAGYRDAERDRKKPPGTYRIAFLGDSFIEALQVAYSQTIPQLLERSLRHKLSPHPVEVLNLASSGFGTTCSYLTLRSSGLSYDPDLVILGFFVGNDVYDNHPQLAAEPNRPFHSIAEDGSLALHEFDVRDTALKRWLRAHSRAYLFLRNRVLRIAALHRLGMGIGLMQKGATKDEMRSQGANRRANSVYLTPSSSVIEEAWETTEGILREMAEVLGARGVPLVVLLIPAREQFDESKARQHLDKLSRPGDHTVDFQLPNRRLRRLLTRIDVPSVDLLPEFTRVGARSTELYFPENGHWTPLGHQIAAKALVPTAADLLRRRMPTTGARSVWTVLDGTARLSFYATHPASRWSEADDAGRARSLSEQRSGCGEGSGGCEASNP